MQALYPHTKLDWSISRIEDQLVSHPDDPEARLDLCRAVLSRGLYHGGGERECNRALALARKALQDDPANLDALILAGTALVGMERPDAAQKYLDQALRIDGERADLRLALGQLAEVRGDHGTGVKQLESACRLAPEAWETHLALGRALFSLARSRGGNQRRLLERSQYHLVRTLLLEPSPDQSAPLFKEMGLACMATGRYKEAKKFFIRLREHEKFAATASFHLGRVDYELGKYNNAIQHWRRFLRERSENAEVLSRMAMAWFQLGEYPKAREACHRALALDPSSKTARQALGCTLLEEGEPNEALRVFREALREHPDDLRAYVEIVRTRRLGGDVPWLLQALATEVGQFDRLPSVGALDARNLTRERIKVVLEELKNVGPSTIGAILGSVHHTQDEGLRFQLWEAAGAMTVGAVADAAAARLRAPGKFYGPDLGAQTLAASAAIPEPVLTAGLGLDEADIKRSAVERHGPAPDVTAHRRNLDKERDNARAYQALLLLSVASRRSPAGRALLRQWAEAADAELATAAWAGLAMYGDPEAARQLRERARQRGAVVGVDRLLAKVTPRLSSAEPHRVPPGEEARCTTCGRGAGEVAHQMAGSNAVICDQCVIRIGQHRRSLRSPEDATCDLCGATQFEAAGMFTYNNVSVCTGCLEMSLGLLEREEVDRFLATW